LQAFSRTGAPLAKRSLTKKQHAMLASIERYFDEHRCSPLIREIQAACQIASYKSAIDRLNALEHKGFIKRVPNKHRGIRLIKKAAGSRLVDATPPSTEQVDQSVLA
jgi:SOS-response transcriptional repressor LexA